jgi:DNA-directed RNA polymerase subunit RPC12/RpoP
MSRPQNVETLDHSVKLRCGKCGYEWFYSGKNPFWASCPWCLSKVNVKKHSLEVLDNIGGSSKN